MMKSLDRIGIMKSLNIQSSWQINMWRNERRFILPRKNLDEYDSELTKSVGEAKYDDGNDYENSDIGVAEKVDR